MAINENILQGGLRLSSESFVNYCQSNRPGRVDFGLLKPLMRNSHIRHHSLAYNENVRYGEDFQFYLDMLLAGGTLLVIKEAYYRYTERSEPLRRRSGVSKTNSSSRCARSHTRALAAILDTVTSPMA